MYKDTGYKTLLYQYDYRYKEITQYFSSCGFWWLLWNDVKIFSFAGHMNQNLGENLPSMINLLFEYSIK